MSSRRQRGPSLEESLATQRRLSRFDDRRSHVKLDLGHSTQRRLYGRDEEITTLLELQKRSMKKDDSGSSVMVVCFVHGLSGSGKTSLCEYLRDRTAGRSYFMSGKFDLQAKIYSAIIEAFENLANQIYENDDKEVMEDLRNHLSLECRMLAKLAPSFSKILGDQDDKKESGEEVASSSFLTFDRIGVTFRNFLQFFCKPDRPLIMFIDDLQWADSKSFAMIRTLLNDKEVHNCLFLGGYRDEDKVRVGLFRGELENTVTDVHVGPLGKESVNALVAGLLAQNEEATESLAALLQKKTLGNAFHVIQFMELLQHKGLLKYNFVGGKWEWDMDQISTQTDVSDNVADILASRIESLPPQVLRILQLAACLGFFVRGDLLEGLALSDLLADTSGDRGSASSDLLSRELFQEAILHAEEEGLLERDHTLVKFSHDRVQLTAYELLPEGKSREELHFRIGKAIHGLSNSNVLLAADQLNRGSPCIHSEVERISLIQLNLDAARVAQRQSAAELVADFLDKALSLSRAGDWSICYELILSVYTMSAEVEATRGRFEQSEELVGTILEHAKSPLDSMPARAVLAEVMAVVFRFEESATVARQALAICGEKLPPATKMGVWVELRKTRRLLRDKGDVELATLPYMKDPMKLAAMKILKLGEMYGFNLSKYLAGLCFLRMAQLTIKYGIDRATGGYAYACYGLHLATFTEDYAEAFRFSRIALKVKGDMASLPGISLVVNGSLTHLKLPSAVGLEQLLEAYRVGLETGQMMMGCICLTIYADAYRHNGLPLGPYADDLRQFGSQLKLCSEDYSSHFLLSNLQLALNLMGESDDPRIISWEVIEKLGLFNEVVTFDDGPRYHNLCYNQIFLSYILCDLDRAEETLNALLSLETRQLGNGCHVANIFFALLDGLLGLALQDRKRGFRRVFRRVAGEGMKWLKHRAQKGAVDCVSLVSFLEAIQASQEAGAKREVVKELFDDVICQLSRAGFVHYAAIANERVGEYMVRNEDTFWAEHYLSRSLQLYEEWGAVVKVLQLRDKYSEILSFVQSATTTTSLRGRHRYTAAYDAFSKADSHRQLSALATRPGGASSEGTDSGDDE